MKREPSIKAITRYFGYQCGKICWDVFFFFWSNSIIMCLKICFWRRKIDEKRDVKKIKVITINRNSIWPRPVCQTKNWQTQLKGRFPSGSKAMWNYPCLLNLSLHFTLIILSDPRDLLANCFCSFYFNMFDVIGKSWCVSFHMYTLRKREVFRASLRFQWIMKIS